jgi:hypothetical protein
MAAIDGDNRTTEFQALALGDQHPRAHAIVFVLGELPLAIRLFSMRGIPWTQACGGVYLSSFPVIATVGMLARRAEDSTTYASHAEASIESMMWMWNRGSFWVMVVVHAGMRTWCIIAVLHLSPGTSLLSMGPDKTTHLVFMFVCLALSIICTIPLLVSSALCFAVISLLPTNGAIRKTAFLPVAMIHFAGIYATSRFGIFLISQVDYTTTLALSCSMYVLWFGFFVARIIEVPPHLLMISFAFTNLVLSVLYYCFRYDPSDTTKALWLGELG